MTLEIIDNALSSEIRYACRYWVHHLEQNKSYIRDEDLTHVFLRKYVFFLLVGNYESYERYI